MIFAHTIDKVLSGEKTQTRRIVKSKEILSHFMTDENLHWQPCVLSRVGGPAKWYAGNTYAVQPGRGKPAVARICITDIRREDVRNISDDDVKAEGFARIVDFWQVWCAIHDKAIVLDPLAMDSGMTIVNYPRINQFTVENHANVRDILMLRPAERYQAWVISFELVRPVDTPAPLDWQALEEEHNTHG